MRETVSRITRILRVATPGDAMLSKLVKSLVVVVAVLAAAVLVLAVVVIEDAPSVPPQDAPTAEDVAKAKRFVKDVKSAARAGSGSAGPLVVAEDELSSVARVGARLVPGFRGEVAVEPWGVEMHASVPVPLPGSPRWLNLAVTVPRFETRLALGQVTLGPLSIPPGLALEVGRIGANVILGNGLGDTAVTAASRMAVTGDTVTVALEIDEVGKNGILRGVFGALRGNSMPPEDLSDAYYVRIREAMDRGDLPIRGSYLPYIVFTLNAAEEGARIRGETPSDAFTAAFFALTRICSTSDFTLVVGSLGMSASDISRDWRTECSRLTLNDRIDSRLHFTTAAAIQAASNRNVSVSVGELKELNDSLSRGFDFTDIAANNSGIRMANLFMATPVGEWPRLIARIRAEEDVIVPYDDIPQILSRKAFSAQFGEIDSDRYRAMLDLIETRIDALALHAPL